MKYIFYVHILVSYDKLSELTFFSIQTFGDMQFFSQQLTQGCQTHLRLREPKARVRDLGQLVSFLSHVSSSVTLRIALSEGLTEKC